MPERQPSSVVNLDRYGYAPLEWSRALDALDGSADEPMLTWFLGTVRPDGAPHAAGVGAVWHEGDLYFTSSPDARKARNLVADPRCTVSVRLKGIDLVLEGGARRITDAETLETLATRYRAGGWPAQVDNDAFTAPYSAPSAGPPPWHLYLLTVTTVFGVAGAEPYGATRWRF